MFIEVIPFETSIDDTGLTYFVPTEFSEILTIGALVEVPIKQSLSPAVVSRIHAETSEADIKSISRIITTQPLLAPYQIEAIYELASRYFVHVHKVLHLFFSKSLFGTFEKKDFRDVKDLAISPSVQSGASREIWFNRTWNSLFPALASAVKTLPDAVCVFPDDFSAGAFARYLGSQGEEVTPYLQSDTPTKKYRHYLAAMEKRNPIIIWSRKTLYYNLVSYSHIFYMEDAFAKTTMNAFHTYKHMDLIECMHTFGHFSLTIASSVPSIESMSLAFQKKYTLKNL